MSGVSYLILQLVGVVRTGVGLYHIDGECVKVVQVGKAIQTAGFVLSVALYDGQVDVQKRSVVFQCRNIRRRKEVIGRVVDCQQHLFLIGLCLLDAHVAAAAGVVLPVFGIYA